MGNRKALLVSLFSALLLGICLVPAFAEDAAISNQNENPSIAVEQPDVSDGVSSTDLVKDEESDAMTSGSAGATTPEKLKSVYDLASEHVVLRLTASLCWMFLVARQMPVKSCSCTAPTIQTPRFGA